MNDRYCPRLVAGFASFLGSLDTSGNRPPWVVDIATVVVIVVVRPAFYLGSSIVVDLNDLH